MTSALIIFVAAAWVSAHFVLYLTLQLAGGRCRGAAVVSFHAVSAAGMAAIVLILALEGWSASSASALAAALALHGTYSMAMLENTPLVEANLARIACDRTAWGPAPSDLPLLARLDAWMRRAERPLALAAFAVLFALVGWYFILRPTYAATFLEYYQKYLPFFTDRGFGGVLDLAALGDPRPRLLPLLGAAIDVDMRRALLRLGTMHPAFGISWLFYPAALAALFQAVYLLTGRRTAAAIACLIYAASPAALDVLVDYYMPAKPLVNFFFITALLGVGLSEPHPSLGRVRHTWLGSALIFLSALGGMLSDETAVFLIAIVGILMTPRLFDRTAPPAERLAAPAALVLALALYLAVGMVVLPLLEERHGYAVVPFAAVVLQGVYAAMFGAAPKPLGGFLRDYDPGSLLWTIVSAHMAIGRTVGGNWTNDHGLRLAETTPREYGQMLAAAAAFAVLMLTVGRSQRRLAWLLLAAFAFFVLGQAILIFPLAPWLVEVNYYASLSSIFVALFGGILLGDLAGHRPCLPLAGLTAAWLAFAGLHNYLETAKRHPGFTDAPLTWGALREARMQALAGGIYAFPDVAGPPERYPRRGRRYLYALEVAMGQEHEQGRRVDVVPLRPIASAPLYRTLHLETLFDTHIPRLAAPGPATLAEARAMPAASVAGANAPALAGKHLRGSTAEWNLDVTVGESGIVRGTAWRPGLMRLWELTGRLAQRADGACLVFDQAPELCLASVVAGEKELYAYDAEGRWVLSFRYAS